MSQLMDELDKFREKTVPVNSQQGVHWSAGVRDKLLVEAVE